MNQPSEREPIGEHIPGRNRDVDATQDEVRSALLTVLVGAEGMSEMRDASWWQEATKEEKAVFLKRHNITGDNYKALLVDGIGRPYWLVTLLENAPEPAKTKAKQYARVLRLID